MGIPVLPKGEAAPIAPELLKLYLDENIDTTLVPAKVVVGGADDRQQQKGVLDLMPAGDADRDSEGYVRWKRIQGRAMAKTLLHAERIGNHVEDLLDGVYRAEITDSLGFVWLLHQISVAQGPSGHIDSSETFESLFFVTVGVGRDPVAIPES